MDEQQVPGEVMLNRLHQFAELIWHLCSENCDISSQKYCTVQPTMLQCYIRQGIVLQRPKLTDVL